MVNGIRAIAEDTNEQFNKIIKNMTTKEMCVEIGVLQGKINDLRESINKGVYNYLKKNIGIESANNEASKDLIGKVVAEEISWYWNPEMDIITIRYCVFRNQWGDFSDEKVTNVDTAVIDKYYHID